MPITLAEAKVGMADHIDQLVIDEFRRGSLLLDKMTFDNCVSPGTGGSTLTYGYTRLLTPSTAEFREINSEYTKNEAKREPKFVNLKIFGGAFSIDRVIAQTSGAVDEVNFQLRQKILATINTFHNAVINGDEGVVGFDGLDVMLAGTSTEINADNSTIIDLSTSAAVDENYKVALDMLDEFLSAFEGTPDMLMGNSKLITKLKACARRAGYLTQSEDSFGKTIETYNGIALVDMKDYYDGEKTQFVVPIKETGVTDLYGARFALDGFHGVTPKGDKIISTHLPDFTTAGAVKDGDVEMVAATVLKNSRAAGVLRNIKVQ